MRADGGFSFIGNLYEGAWAACVFEAEAFFHVAFIRQNLDAFVQRAFADVDGKQQVGEGNAFNAEKRKHDAYPHGARQCAC